MTDLFHFVLRGRALSALARSVMLVIFVTCALHVPARGQDCGVWLPGPGSPDLPPGASVSKLAASGTDLYALVRFESDSRVWRMRSGVWQQVAWDAAAFGEPQVLSTDGGQVAVITSRQTSEVGFPLNVRTVEYAVRTFDGTAWSLAASVSVDLSTFASTTTRREALRFADLTLYNGAWYLGGTFSSSATLGGSAWGVIYRSDGATLSRVAQTNIDGCSFVCLNLPTITSLQVANGSLVVGGRFSSITPTGGAAVTAGNLARLVGTTWQGFSSSPNNVVAGMFLESTITLNANLVIWGEFTQVGTLAATRIARWNTFNGNWTAVGTGVAGTSGLGSPAAVVQIQGTGGINDIDYVAVGVSQAGGVNVDGCARWTGSVWQNYGGAGETRLTGTFNTAVNFGGVTVGGSFLAVGVTTPSPRFGVSKWNGTTWTYSASQGTDGVGLATATFNGDAYVGGDFTKIDSVSASRVARRNAAAGAWQPLGAGVNGPVRSLMTFGSDLIAGGDFGSAGSVSASNIAAWDGTQWRALGAGLNGTVRGLTVWNGSLVAVGSFTASGATTTGSAARWTGTAWVAVDPAFTATLHAAGVLGTTLYVGGDQGLARLNGSVLQPVIGNPNGPVYAVFPLLGSLYVGGDFTVVGSPAQSNPRFARYNGSVWLPAGTNSASDFTYGSVRSIFGSSDEIFAVGEFSVATATDGAVNAARFDGTQWRSLSSQSSNAIVRSGTIAGGRVVVAGDFTQIGTTVSFAAGEWSRGPVFLSGPASQTICQVGGQLVLSVQVASSAATTLQWRRNAVAITDNLRISGSGTPTLTIEAISGSDAGTYDCVVTNCGSAASPGATISIGGCGCSPSDVAGPNQSIGSDGLLTADDIIVFLGWFFASDSRADVAGANQATVPDGVFTADDIIIFLGRFFAGC